MAVDTPAEIDIKFNTGNPTLDKQLLQNFAIIRQQLDLPVDPVGPVDADTLDGIDSVGFSLAAHDHDADYLGISAKAADSELLDSLDSTAFALAGHNHDAVYLGITAQAADSALLGGKSLSDIFHVGCFHFSAISTNPNALFGFGTWSRIGVGKMLIDGGAGFTEGSSGGQATSNAHGHGAGTLVTGTQTATQTIQSGSGDTAPSNLHLHGISGSVANNSPATNDNYSPYLSVYIWQRTA